MELVKKWLVYVINLLPMSPFTTYIEQFSQLPYLNWVNWFIPVGDMVKIGMAWLTAIGIFYLYSIILRWIRAIE